MHLSIYDYGVMGFYLVFMFLLGPVYKSFSKTASDYFRGGGSMLWWIVGSSAFMTTFTAWSFTGGAAKAYETGTFFMLLYFCNFWALVFMYFFTAAKYRQMRVITAIEAVRKRFGGINEQVFTWLYIPTYVMFGGVWLYSISIFISGAFGINMEALIVILGVVVVAMTLFGGSWAATAGDFVQMLIVLIITIMMAVMVLQHPEIHGIHGLIDKLPSYHLNWTEFDRPAVIIFFAVTLLINQLIQMNSMTMGAARFVFVKNGKDSRKAVLISMIGFVVLTPIWMIPAVAATYFHPDLASEFPKLNNPNEAAYVAMAITLLPKGLLGLLICAIFAASMTTMNSQLNTSSGTFVRNFYIRIIDKNASEARQILIGRIFIFIYGAIWIIVALTFKSMEGLKLFDLLLLIAASIGIPIAIPMFFGIFVKKTPPWSGWSTMLIGLVFSFLLRMILKPEFIQTLTGRFFTLETELSAREIGDLNIAITTAVLFIVCVGWFFLTMLFNGNKKIKYSRQVDEFFEEMHTPIDMENELPAEYESDSRQTKVMGNLCLVYGSFILLLLLIPNTLTSRLYIASCGLFMAGFGLILRIRDVYLKCKAFINNSEPL